MDGNVLKRVSLELFDSLEHDLLCPICQDFLKNPVLTLCGHNFCQNCLQQALQRRPSCPLDATPLETPQAYFPDKRIERQVFNKLLRCPNPGCPWKDALGQLEKHLQGCGHELVPCPLLCGVPVPRGSVPKHLGRECTQRKVLCRSCKNTFTYEELKGRHETTCPRRPTPCPNQCGLTIPLEDLPKHRSQCPSEIVPCPFLESGCAEVLTRKQLEEHLKGGLLMHLMIFQQRGMRMEKEYEECKRRLGRVEGENRLLRARLSMLEGDKGEVLELRWMFIENSLLSFSDEFKTARNTTQHWINQPFAQKSAIHTGTYLFYLYVDSQSFSPPVMDIGVALFSDVEGLVHARNGEEGLELIRKIGKMFALNECGIGSGDLLLMKLLMGSKQLQFFRVGDFGSTLLHQIEDIPEGVIPMVTLSPSHSLSITLLGTKII